MENWICTTCGSQFTESEKPPRECPICLDQRQYVGYEGQKWTTQSTLHADGFRNTVKEHEAGLLGIGSTPTFAIGQRALLVQTGQGNILWDCISLLDRDTVEAVKQLGGLKAIAISHPHYYGSMVDWAEEFNVPVYLHEADRQWVMRPGERIRFWSGETLSLMDAVTLIRLGGHFAGGTVLHWASGAESQGLLLSGDIISVVADRKWVSFMYSYPNLIPLPASEVKRMRDTVARYNFERLYGAWFATIVVGDAKNAVLRSADRYIRALEGGPLG
jgi:hypothetical protein